MKKLLSCLIMNKLDYYFFLVYLYLPVVNIEKKSEKKYHFHYNK